MDKVLDFDRFLAEKQEETLTVRVYGKDYRVKKEIPALVPVLLARHAEDDAQEKGKALLQAGDLMFGREAIDGFCRRGMSAEKLAALVEQVFARILGTEEKQVLEDDGTVEDKKGK